MSNELKFTPNQIIAINHCYKQLNMPIKSKTNATFDSSVSAIDRTNSYLQHDAEEFNSVLNDLNMAITDRSTDGIVDALKSICSCIEDLKDDVETLVSVTQDALISFRKAGIPPFTLICSDEHIKETIDQYFTYDTTFSIGFKDGEYALIFCNIVDGNEVPKYHEVVAKGDVDCFDAVKEYILSAAEMDGDDVLDESVLDENDGEGDEG